jgi:iron complex transport system substrate-binding protein
LPQRSVIYLVALDPPMSAGRGTFVHELIGIAGGRNVMSDASALWPPVSVEDVLSRQPDVVIVSATDVARDDVLANLRRRPGWRGLAAVQAGRVHVVDTDLFNRPGPSLVFAVGAMAAAIHPELER